MGDGGGAGTGGADRTAPTKEARPGTDGRGPARHRRKRPGPGVRLLPGTDLPEAKWRKSSYSDGGEQCVEIADTR
ncbi:DUF397 domain-containing protein, partial [Streptomyces sp. NPDC051211]|uniref:DUF397 domain-containing protein n=1 Tax=Streptomyces sp. NPDC051211 TaxID=3154643 RepID=UPI00344FFE73